MNSDTPKRWTWNGKNGYNDHHFTLLETKAWIKLIILEVYRIPIKWECFSQITSFSRVFKVFEGSSLEGVWQEADVWRHGWVCRVCWVCGSGAGKQGSVTSYIFKCLPNFLVCVQYIVISKGVSLKNSFSTYYFLLPLIKLLTTWRRTRCVITFDSWRVNKRHGASYFTENSGETVGKSSVCGYKMKIKDDNI